MLVANFYQPPDYEYGDIARNILAGAGFSRTILSDIGPVPTSSHAPLYPFFLTLFYWTGTKPFTYFIIQLIQAILSTLTIYIIFKTSRIIFNYSVARLTEWLVGLYPPLIYYCTKLVPTTTFLFLISLSIYLIIANRNFISNIFCGIVLGLTILCDPVALVLYPVIILCFIVSKNINFFKTALIIIVSLFILAPWTIRNYQIHKTLIPVTTQFGVNFWIGNNPNATGTDFFKIRSIENDDYILMTQTLAPNILDSLNRVSEIDRMRFYIHQAVEFIKEKPLGFFKLLIKKCYYYWWFANSSEYRSRDLQKYSILLYISYIPVLILGWTGLLLSIKEKRPVLLIILAIFSISGLYIFTHIGLVRYRIPVELLFLLFSGYFIKSFRK